MRQHPAFFQMLEQKALLNHQKNKEVQSPEDEVPCGAMPETGQKPYHKDIKKLSAAFDTVAAQRDVNIIAEPGAEGDVPTPPEFGDAFGDVRIVKVLWEIETQHPAQTNRHQRITAEIKINLEGICQQAHPRQRGGNVGKAQGLYLGPKCANGVRQQNLAAQSHDKQPNTFFHLCQCDGAVFHLLADVGIQNDRSGNQLREQDNERTKINQVVLHLDFSSVYINGIRQNLEGVEADAQRKMELRRTEQRQAGAEQGVDVAHKEVGILKEEQKAQSNGKRQPKTNPAQLRTLVIALHQKSRNIVDANGNQHHWEKLRFSPGIKEQTCQKQHGVL